MKKTITFPAMPGDTVYRVYAGKIYKEKVDLIRIDRTGDVIIEYVSNEFDFLKNFDRSVFLSEKDAEKSIKK